MAQKTELEQPEKVGLGLGTIQKTNLAQQVAPILMSTAYMDKLVGISEKS